MGVTFPLVIEPAHEASPLNPGQIDSLNGGVFPSTTARDALLEIYNAKLARWPVHYEEFDIPTSYGRAHVVAAGSPAAPPLIMLHMAACSSFIWTPVIAAIAGHYRAYAIDMIGDVNKSTLNDPRHYPKSGNALAAWLCEVADKLQVGKTDVIAGSYGGWLGMHYATYAPERVRRLALIVPMGLPAWIQTMRVLFRLIMIQIGQSPLKMERTLSYLMGDDPRARELCGDWFAKVFAWKCKMKVPSPLPLSGQRLGAIRMPTMIILGGRDPLIGDANRAARRARTHIHELEIDIVPNGTHAVHVEEPDRVSGRILEFLGR